MSSAIDKAARSALEEVPDGPAPEMMRVFMDHLSSELRNNLTLDPSQKAAFEKAFVSILGLANNRLQACFPPLAPFAERNAKWAAENTLPAPPDECRAFFDAPTYRAMSGFLSRVMEWAWIDVPSGGTDLLKAFQSRRQSTAESESLPQHTREAVSTLFDKLDPEDVVTCVPVLAPLVQQAKICPEPLKRRKVQAEARRMASELTKDSISVMGTAYHAYLDVKRCYEARESYSVPYITYEEMGLATNAVRQIKDTMKPKLDPATTVDGLWSRFEQKEGHHFYPSRDYVEGERRVCREWLNWLLQIQRDQVPESRTIESPCSGL